MDEYNRLLKHMARRTLSLRNELVETNTYKNRNELIETDARRLENIFVGLDRLNKYIARFTNGRGIKVSKRKKD